MAQKVVLEIQVNDEELILLENGLNDLGAKFKLVEEGSKKVKRGVNDLGISSKVMTKLDQLTGGWATSIVDVASGLKDVVKGINLSKTALIATGIGAFVVLLGTIVAYWDDIKNYVSGVNLELEEQKRLSDAINLTLERRSQLEKDNERYMSNKTKELLLRAKIAGASEEELTKIERDGLVERLALAQEYADKSNQILKDSLGTDEETYLAAQKNQLKAEDDLAKAKGAIAAFDLESKVPGKGKKSGKGKGRDKIDKINPLTGADADAEINAIKAYYDTVFDIDKQNKDALQSLADSSNDEFLNSKEVAEAKASEIDREYSDVRKRIAQEEFNQKMALYGGVADGLSSLGDIVGRETAAGKALAVSGALINTYASIAGQLKAFAGVPIPGFAIAQAAATALTGFAAVKNILSVKVPGGGGGGGSVRGGGSPSRPPSFNVVGNNPQNQLNQALLEKNNQPVQAFVVDKDVTTGQELRRNKIESSSL